MISLDYDGDGTVDAQGPDLQSKMVNFSRAGLFVPRVVATDKHGQPYEATGQVTIENPEEFQSALNAR